MRRTLTLLNFAGVVGFTTGYGSNLLEEAKNINFSEETNYKREMAQLMSKSVRYGVMGYIVGASAPITLPITGAVYLHEKYQRPKPLEEHLPSETE